MVRRDAGQLHVLRRAVLPAALDAEGHRVDAARRVVPAVGGAVLAQEPAGVPLALGGLTEPLDLGAFPVGVDELGKPSPDVKINPLKLEADKTGGLFQHGYIMIQLKGDQAAVTYYQYDAETGKEKELDFKETL